MTEPTTGATPWPDITDEIPLRDQVAEAAFSCWSNQNGGDVVWRREHVDDATRAAWLAIADDAIAAIEFDYRIAPADRVLDDDLAHWLTYHKDDRDFLFDYLEACIDDDTDAQQRVVTRDMFDRLLEALRGQADRILAADAARTKGQG